MEHYTKKKRTYLTSKSYLNKVKRACILIAVIGLLGSASIVFFTGVTFLSLGIVGCIGLMSLASIYIIRKNARCVSLKAGNLILKTINKNNIVAPLGSLRRVETRPFFGFYLTRVRYHLDGGSSQFFIVTKAAKETPEVILKREVKASRDRKKEANHKPDSVLTQIA